MALSISASSYPLKIMNDAKKCRKSPGVVRSLHSSSSFSSLQSSSLPLKTTQDPKNPSEHRNIINSKPCYTQENTVGVIGGVSVLSTLKIMNGAKMCRKTPGVVRSLPSSSSFSSLQSSSLPLKTTQDPKNPSEHRNIINSKPCYTQENTVGIIGGVSVLSTLIFLEKFVLWSSRDKKKPVPFIVCSDPQKTYESVRNSDTFSDTFNCNVMVDDLRRKRLFLEDGGARCIVMPCHVSHVWYDEISKGCKFPFLHVGECVAMELREARFRPMEAGCGVRIGIIATDDTLMAGFYQEKLNAQGFEVILPERSTMEHIIYPAIESLKRKDLKGARNLLRIAIQALLVKAVNTVILASHELQNVLPYDDPLLKKCVDPMDALARSVVRWAKSPKSLKKF